MQAALRTTCPADDRGSIRSIPRWFRIAICLLLLGVCGGRALAQGKNISPNKPPAADTDGEVALHFPPNVQLNVLVDYVSQRLGINILYDEQMVHKRITLKTPTKVPVSSLMDVLQSALRMKGLVMVDDPKTGWKRIVQATNLQAISKQAKPAGTGNDQGHAAQDVVTEVFRLRFADPKKIDPIVKPFLTQPGGNTISLTNLHLLIVTDFASNLPRLTRLIRLADQPPEAVQIKFVPIADVDAQKLAAQVKELLLAKVKIQGGAQASVSDLTVEADARTNRLVVLGTPDRVAAALKLIQSLDVPLHLVTKIYPFEVASPKRVDALVKQLVGPLAVDRLYRSAIDEQGNMLIVTAPEDIQRQVVAIQKQWDRAASKAASPVRFYKLLNTSAADVLATIQQLEGASDENGTNGSNHTLSGIAAAATQPSRRILPTVPSGANRPPAAPGEALPKPPAYRQPGPVTPEASTLSRSAAANNPALDGAQVVHTPSATVVADQNTNSIIVIAPPAQQQVYAKLIKMLDQRRPQVLIQTTIMTLDTSHGFSLGVELSHTSDFNIGNHDTQAITFSSFGLSKVDASSGGLTIKPGLGFNGAILSSNLANVVIRALENSGRATVLSAPQILVNDNATGSISTVNEQPFTSVNASTTVSTTSFAGFVSAGTQISVTPHIAEGDHLRLEFKISLSSFTGQSSAGIPPPRQTNDVSSEATVPDGDTIIVGGIHRKDWSTTVQAVPFLGQIPLLKYLFRSQDDKNSDSTLFVFIRPLILRDDQFRDLKYLSNRELDAAGLPAGMPQSEPILMP